VQTFLLNTLEEITIVHKYLWRVQQITTLNS
jgi:hypothetical protein